MDVIIPAPANIAHGAGELSLRSIMVFSVSEPTCLTPAEQFRIALNSITGIDLPSPTVGARECAPDTTGIHIELCPLEAVRQTRGVRADGAHPGIEHYQVTVDRKGVLLRAASPEGVHRALTSLLQLAILGDDGIPFIEIADAPAFAWRGLSLDVARAFVPIEQIERVIDMLSLHKFNVLHLHLTDNEAWRLHIDSRPKLTEIGDRGIAAKRPGGHYTHGDFRSIIEYAADRFVTIVPEIDLPGHAKIALEAYPELAAPDTDSPHVDPGSPEAWRFVDDVLRELAELSPSPYVHIGGDEAFGMPDADHARFVERMLVAVSDHGKRVVGWQEICRAQLTTDVIVQHWISPVDLSDEAVAGTVFDKVPAEIRDKITAHFTKAEDDLSRIAQQEVGLLLSPTDHVYLDRPHGDPSDNPEQEVRRSTLGLPLYPARTLEELFEWDPMAEFSDIDSSAIIGVEAAVWCETVETMDDLELLMLPRLSGVAEAAWSADARSTWEEHRHRLATHARLYRRHGWIWYRSTSVDWDIDA